MLRLATLLVATADARTWRSTYDWTAGHGSAGWTSATTTSDPGAYGFGPLGFGPEPGLLVWPTGDREYRPAAAEWRLDAPGTTRIRTSALRCRSVTTRPTSRVRRTSRRSTR